MARDAIGVGLVGQGWIARAHAHALHTINHIAPLARPVRLVSIAGRDAQRLERTARELGFERWTTDWGELVADDEVDVVGVVAANEVHAPTSTAALERGKPVLCEKPLGLDAAEARDLAAAAEAARVTHACGFNYRFVPAVRLARRIVDDGRLGRLRHVRAVYLQDWAKDPAFHRARSAMGAVIGYCHLVDLLRYLGAEPTAVVAHVTRFEPATEHEDAFAAVLQLPEGALASLEASRCATGWKGRQVIELNGSEGSLWWNMEDLNRLHVFLARDEGEGLGGFRDVLVTQPEHPFVEHWWTPGHTLGWEASFLHQWRSFLEAALEGMPVPPDQASFDDGHRAAVICDAVLAAAEEGRCIELDWAQVPTR